MEIHTGTLDERQLQAEMEYLPGFFASRGIEQVLVAFGWGCRLTLDELWSYQPVAVGALIDYITQSRREDRFYLGQSDLLIASEGEDMRFLFCHEADIHFEGGAEEISEVSAHWRARGYGVEAD